MKLTRQNKNAIMKYLGKYKLMALGTYDKSPWSAWVYYLFDDDLNLYFVSSIKTKHALNIAKNPKVSVAITDPFQDPKGNKVGFQARGKAKAVKSLTELKEIVKSWNKRGFVPITYKLFIKALKSRFYKIKLSEVQMFDENQPEDKEVRVWKL